MPKSKHVEKLTYEEAFEELTLLVKQLEEGDLPLEEALALFERGQELGVRCNQLLEHAELRLRPGRPDELVVAVALPRIDPDEDLTTAEDLRPLLQRIEVVERDHRAELEALLVVPLR